MRSDLQHTLQAFAHLDLHICIAYALLVCCTMLVLFSIAADFVLFHRHRTHRKKVNSWVETGSMMLYLLVFCCLFRLTAGQLHTDILWINRLCLYSGTLLVVTGCLVNLSARITLKQNWANQVTLYEGQTLVRNGMYRIVRHPLYASLIGMFSGAACIRMHVLALLSVGVIFVPMMIYRARQEEKLLFSEFPGYADYSRHVGMLFPKILPHDTL